MDQFLEFVKSIQAELAGVVGSIIAVLWHRSEMASRWDFVFYILSGLVTVYLCTDPLLEWQKIDAKYAAMVGFGLGAFSGSFFAFVFRFLKSDVAMDVVKNFFGRFSK